MCEGGDVWREQERVLCKSCLKANLHWSYFSEVAYLFGENTARNIQALNFLPELGSGFISVAFVCTPGSRTGGRRPRVQAEVVLELSVSHCHFTRYKWLREDKEWSSLGSRGNIFWCMHEFSHLYLVTQFAHFWCLNQLCPLKYWCFWNCIGLCSFPRDLLFLR